MLWFLIPALVVFWIISGAAAATMLARKFNNSCSRRHHDGCFHYGAAPLSGALWPLALPFWLIVGSVAGLVYVGVQAGRTHTQRAESVERTRDAVRSYREGQIKAANNELERQLYGEQKCKHCQHTLVRKDGMWVEKSDGSNGCTRNPGRYGGPHAVPDAIDAKIDQARRERDDHDTINT